MEEREWGEGGWWREDVGGSGDEGGVWSRVKQKIERMERVEHNTTIGNIVIN